MYVCHFGTITRFANFSCGFGIVSFSRNFAHVFFLIPCSRSYVSGLFSFAGYTRSPKQGTRVQNFAKKLAETV